LADHLFWVYWLISFGAILSRYFLVAGGTYFLFYRVLGEAFTRSRLRSKAPRWQAVYRDMKLSALSTVVFALAAAVVISSYDAGLTRLYADFHQYGLWYLGFSFVIVLLLQDLQFYFMHRLFHQPLLFKWLHAGHHRAGEPTPWTSFAFDLPESLVQAFFFVGIIFVIPLHFATLIAVLITMTVWSVLNHIGFRLFPATIPYQWLGRWLIGPMHHSLHHRKYTVHYGLYFTFWDKLLGTQEADYEKAFCRTHAKIQSDIEPVDAQP
jgi:sterol desaturase/sphingolipid hydroxylase (fatty acid hydroxylase superfamily)